MPAKGPNASRYSGYRTPFHDEVYSERLYSETLKHPGAELLPVGRQLKVFQREALDLMALDARGNRWVFEFKRDVASYKSIGQLIAYGSYVVRWSRSELEGIYAGDDGRRDLGRAFYARFGADLPDRMETQVNLVLAAFEFSLPCRRGLQFLERAGLVIGRLKIDCVWDMKKEPQPEYRWLRHPTPTKSLFVHSEPVSPDRYYILSIAEAFLVPTWDECVSNRLLPVPEGWGIRGNPIPPNSGIFVHTRSLGVGFEDSGSDGLVGYGITSGPAFNLWNRPGEFEVCELTQGKLNESEGPFWVLPVQWVQTRQVDSPVAPSFTFLDPHLQDEADFKNEPCIQEKPGLQEILSTEEALRLKADMEVDPYDPFDDPAEGEGLEDESDEPSE